MSRIIARLGAPGARHTARIPQASDAVMWADGEDRDQGPAHEGGVVEPR
jgi:hypothetical protein